MKDTKTSLEYSIRRSSLINRLTAWAKHMSVVDFTIPTDNPYVSPIARYTVFYKGDLKDADNVLVRVQSACLLGRVLGFDDCDCQRQLLRSFDLLEDEERGLLIYCNDDHGKGVGLANHAKTLAVEKSRRLDEDSARTYLGLKDLRDYKPAIVVLNHFGIKSIRLLTNNASKLDIFKKYSIPARETCLVTN